VIIALVVVVGLSIIGALIPTDGTETAPTTTETAASTSEEAPKKSFVMSLDASRLNSKNIAVRGETNCQMGSCLD